MRCFGRQFSTALCGICQFHATRWFRSLASQGHPVSSYYLTQFSRLPRRAALSASQHVICHRIRALVSKIELRLLRWTIVQYITSATDYSGNLYCWRSQRVMFHDSNFWTKGLYCISWNIPAVLSPVGVILITLRNKSNFYLCYWVENTFLIVIHIRWIQNCNQICSGTSGKKVMYM